MESGFMLLIDESNWRDFNLAIWDVVFHENTSKLGKEICINQLSKISIVFSPYR